MAEAMVAAVTALQAQLVEMKEEMEKLRKEKEVVKYIVETDDDEDWVEEQPGAGWQEFLQAVKLPSTAPLPSY